MIVSFEVPGKAVPKGRPRRGANGRFFTPKETKVYEQTVGMMARNAMRSKKPTTEEVFVRMKFYFDDRRKRDLDNLVKAVLDGCNSIVFADDKQVTRLEAAIFRDSKPRVAVQVMERIE